MIKHRTMQGILYSCIDDFVEPPENIKKEMEFLIHKLIEQNNDHSKEHRDDVVLD